MKISCLLSYTNIFIKKGEEKNYLRIFVESRSTCGGRNKIKKCNLKCLKKHGQKSNHMILS